LSGNLVDILDDRFFEAIELDLIEKGKHPAKYLPQCRQSIYKSYIEHIASNKALVVDDLIDYKMHIPFDPNYDIAIDTFDVNEDEIKTY